MLWIPGLLTLSGLVVGFCSFAANRLEREAITRQQIRTDEIACRLEERFLVIEQVARTLAALVAPMRSRSDVEELLRSVLGSTQGHFVYGLGVWFEPYAFSPHERYFGPYVHRDAPGGTGAALTYEWTTPTYDFHHHAWYETGLRARGVVTFVEPYFDTDYVYISSLTAIVDDEGRVRGVASVGVLRPQIQQLVADETLSESRDVTSAIELDHLKDQFLEVTAHELKTPITIMKSYAQLALREGDHLPASLRKKLEGINRGADRIDRILRDLLDVSQVYLGRLQLLLTALDLRELLEQTAGSFRDRQSKHRVRVEAPRAAIVAGDRRRLENVVLTLLDNAVRYSPEGGDIDVSLTVEREEAVVAVEDHGIGIPAAAQARIFERFYRAHSGTDHDQGGLGVGLYISKQLVRQLGGRMWFLSAEGGSRFMFSLPLAKEGSGA